METGAVVETIDLNQGGIPGQLILGVTLGLYMLILLVLSLIASKNIKSEEDFLVAGRRLGLFLCWGSIIATWFGAETVAGSAQSARDYGLVGTILDPWACSCALVLTGIFYAPKLWAMKLYTTGDFFRRVYGTKAELTCSAVQIPSYFGWIAAQYLALANVLLVYFRIPENWGIIIAFAIALIFTMIGGMWSVTLIDTVQILIAFVGLIVLVFVSLVAFGNGSLTDGLNRLFAETPAQDFSLFEAPDATLAVVLATCGTWATGVFGGPLGQDLHQRIFSARSAATARWACIFSGVSYLAFGMIPLAIGLMARIELPPNSTFAEVRVLMYMAGHNLSVPLAIIFVVSFVSIVLSTACSAVLTPATVLGNNFLSRIPVCHRNRLMVERLCVLVMSLFGVWTAYSGESLFGLLDLSLSISLVALFVPLTMGLYGKPKGELPAILAMVLGILFFGFRYAPEKIGYGLPESFGPCRVTVATQLKNLKWDESVKAAVSSESLTVETAATENNSGEQERNSHQAELVEEAIERARLSMHTEFSKFVSPQRADELTDRNFVSGVDWVTYMNLIFPKEKIGLLGMTVPGFKVFGHAFERGTLLTLLLTIPADLWGLLASFLGYFVGQFLLRSPQPRARL